MNILLHAIEQESTYHNMKLNNDKCNAIVMYGRSNITLENGQPMMNAQEVTYLGGIIDPGSSSGAHGPPNSTVGGPTQ